MEGRPPATTGSGRQAGESECGVADGEVELTGLGAIEAEAGIEDLVGAEEVGIAKGDLLVEDADVAIGLAVERNRNAGKLRRSPCGR